MKLGRLFIIGSLIISISACKRQEKYVKVVENATPKAIMITVLGFVENEDGEERKAGYRGAGVLISDNNHILTCAHLFWMKKITGILVCNSDQQCTAADLLYKEDEKDLGLLQAFFDTPTPYIKLADPRSLRVGQEVIAIGNPLGLDFSVCHGIISALYRDIGTKYNLTQTDAMINPGNSGGPLIDLDGHLVGINESILPVIPFIPINSGLSLSVQPGQIIEFLTRFRKLDVSLPPINESYWNKVKKIVRFK